MLRFRILRYLSAFCHLNQWYKELQSEFCYLPIAFLNIVWSAVALNEVCLRLGSVHHDILVESSFYAVDQAFAFIVIAI